LRIAVDQKGTVRQGQVTGAKSRAGDVPIHPPRANSADFSAEYRFTRKLSAFVGGPANINEAVDDTVIYGPQHAARFARSVARADYSRVLEHRTEGHVLISRFDGDAAAPRRVFVQIPRRGRRGSRAEIFQHHFS